VARNPSASYSLTMRLEIPSEAGSFALVAAAVAEAEGDMGAIDLVRVSKDHTVRDITVSASDSEHGQRIIDEVRAVPGVTLVNVSDRTFLMDLGGKIEVTNKVPI
jgi:malate dehydrogenase (oxaloacetate-decarboxylating)